MAKAHVKKMFPGAVTARGFFSYYNYIINPDAEHIFVIKGGPGVGKSTFMKKIGDSMLQAGYDIELHCCSSDNGSIDGLVIPKLNLAFLDGTAPHVVDPKNPGAVDEIVNLGQYWDEKILRQAKPEILASNHEVGHYFQRAYFALSEAKIAWDEWKFYISEHQNWAEVNRIYLAIEQALFTESHEGRGQDRHLFAWAHTPEGKVQYIDTLLTGCHTFYTLQGHPGTGKSTFLNRIAERAITFGFAVEYFHNTLDPAQLDLVIIPSLGIALGINNEPYEYKLNFSGKTILINFDLYLSKPTLTKYEKEIQSCRVRLTTNIERAIQNSSMAKQAHDLMETYYIAAMDFSAIEQQRLAIMRQILRVNENESIAVDNSESPLEI